jgi:uncharacterized membrane protein YeaQ/YmgE (transglycosylase-associated protein family)
MTGVIIILAWAAFGATLGVIARGAFVVDRPVAMSHALIAGTTGALIGGPLTNLACGRHITAADLPSWAGSFAGAAIALAILALITTHRTRTAKLR